MSSTLSTVVCSPITKRALLIGNNDYKNSPQLLCCVNDAQDLKEKLHSINFKVTIGINLTLKEMGEMIDNFMKEICKGDLVVFFFAGHGSQGDGQDYLLPIDDEKISSSDNLRYYAINTQATLQHIMDKRPLATVFLLDCCRRNFSDGNRRAVGSKLDCNIQPVAGSLIAYACGAGKSANDNGKNGRNGVFTSHLLQNITEPNVRIEDMMSQVCHGVMVDTDDRQTPVRMCALRNSNIHFNYRTELLCAPPNNQNPELQKLIINEESDALHLCEMNLIDEDMKIVAYYAIGNKETIKTLNLAANRIGPDGAQHLADALRKNETITTLLLAGNQIGDEGAKYLANALQVNKKLTNLGLGQNYIGDQGAQYLVDALQKNKTLTVLTLEFNDIGTQWKKNLKALEKINKKLNISW